MIICISDEDEELSYNIQLEAETDYDMCINLTVLSQKMIQT